MGLIESGGDGKPANVFVYSASPLATASGENDAFCDIGCALEQNVSGLAALLRL
ncbi:hypothetical protein [Pseudoruegeria sp. SHC-113]|uniref:hypothetical protein n=1 Tax=Pseudoruegeria sp. SHC-113 TaxID=2855439 RepID=UPI0021BB8B52|nr:hypothetical protein [Pseudoruegeria sp. SHC-113]MCT8160222.1 hypothetical protein [Pseudoruegeria sp. SHC-113]